MLRTERKGTLLPRAFTAEERAAAQERAKANRRANAAKFRRDFADEGEWERLAKARGMRLPIWTLAPTPGNMRKWLRKTGWTGAQYLEWAGEKTLSDFAKRNPDWPLRAWVGLVLEAQDVAADTEMDLIQEAV